MATRRIFAKSITDSARFLRLPVSARLLYYDLGMAADDEGAVEGFTVLRKTGATDDDLMILHNAGFVQMLNEEQVCFISDWWTNNLKRRDRFHEGIYHSLLVENGLEAKWDKDGNQTEPESNLTNSNLTKNNLTQLNSTTRREDFFPPSVCDVQEFCSSSGLSLDATAFVSYYSSNGWQAAGKPIRDWRAVARRWAQDGGQSSTKYGTESLSPDELAYIMAGVQKC